jgi:RNA polymerase-binding transcription factor DksA
MATKKALPKKAAKAAKPVKKAQAKPARPASGKPAAKKPAPKAPVKKTIGKKAAPKKAAHPPAPAKKAAATKKAVKPEPKPLKKVIANNNKKAVPPAKKAPEPKPAAPAKSVEPVKKPAVSAPTQPQVKPAIKPIEKPIEKPIAKKDPPKPVKVVIPKTSTTKAVKYEPDFTKSVLDSPHHENTGPTMRYSDAELTEFRDLIMKKLDTAKKELAYLQGLITRKDEGDMEDGRYMTMEDGSMSMEREQLSQMASRQIQFIDHLEKAIMRIENKTYGICRVTGKLIDKARLRAVPHATLSIEAKQMMSK